MVSGRSFGFYLFSPGTLYNIYQMQVDIFHGLQERKKDNALGSILLFGSNVINTTTSVLFTIQCPHKSPGDLVKKWILLYEVWWCLKFCISDVLR